MCCSCSLHAGVCARHHGSCGPAAAALQPARAGQLLPRRKRHAKRTGADAAHFCCEEGFTHGLVHSPRDGCCEGRVSQTACQSLIPCAHSLSCICTPGAQQLYARAAPMAMAVSGSNPRWRLLPANASPTARRTARSCEAPPTRTMSSISDADKPAARSASSMGWIARCESVAKGSCCQRSEISSERAGLT